MIITEFNLDLFYHNKKKACFDKYKEIQRGQIGYELEVGQSIYCLTYSGMSSNRFIKYFCNILDIDGKGILFTDWDGVEVFYQWDFNCKNYLGKIEKMKLIIRPCDYLFEKYPIKKLIKGEIEDYVYSGFNDEWHSKIWYKHGGWKKISKYESNLKNFRILGQQELV